MALDYPALLDELRCESDLLASHVLGLSVEQWSTPTPAEGWNIQDQISHLAFFDDATRLALIDPEQFRPMADELIAGGMDFPDRIARAHHQMPPAELVRWYLDARRDLLEAFAGADPKRRVPWFGPQMSIASSVTARLMETWAHGHDIYEALGVDHDASPGLRSIAHLGVSTFAFAHRIHGLEVPTDPVRIELCSPDNEVWIWGPTDAENVISGMAQDFVLVVTQRRNWKETGLNVVGPVSIGWMGVAQAFAGAPSTCKCKAVPR